MNILYIAVSCSPYQGSEDKIGWNIPVESAGKNRVFVLTREDQRQYIENYLTRNCLHNISFYYVDIPRAVKRLYAKGIYSIGLNMWHRKALQVAGEICKRENVDIVHQITPVEFRSIGNYGRIPGVRFVCGPIAGGQKIPRQLESYLSAKQSSRECLRSLVNNCSRFFMKHGAKLGGCDFVLYANRETAEYLTSCASGVTKSAVIPDVCVGTEEICLHDLYQKQRSLKCRFLVAARLVYLKGHSLLLDALAELPAELDYECMVVGQGTMETALIEKCTELGLSSKVIFKGAVPYEQMQGIYDAADVLVMPSFREATGSVILEAMARGLPVITLDRFGGALLVDKETGWLYDGASREACVDQLKDALMECILNPLEVRRKGESARQRATEFTWEKRVEYYQSIYESLVKAENE